MQLLTLVQAVDQGCALVFLEWLTINICQHELLSEYESLTRYVMFTCKDAQVSHMAVGGGGGEGRGGRTQEKGGEMGANT